MKRISVLLLKKVLKCFLSQADIIVKMTSVKEKREARKGSCVFRGGETGQPSPPPPFFLRLSAQRHFPKHKRP